MTSSKWTLSLNPSCVRNEKTSVELSHYSGKTSELNTVGGGSTACHIFSNEDRLFKKSIVLNGEIVRAGQMTMALSEKVLRMTSNSDKSSKWSFPLLKVL